MSNLKAKILLECKNILTLSLENIRTAMHDAQTTANDYGMPKDRYDSFRTQMLSKRDMFAQQVQRTLDEITLIEKIDPDLICKTVVFGAVVKTTNQNMIIATGLGKIIVDGETFYSISTAVPIYKTIQGLKKGDSYSFQGKNYKIIDVL
ncbi:MAG: hypothetical protein WCK02_12750 [Bacteroidota bacterium]